MRILIIILLTLWSLFSWYYYVCKIKHACWGDNHITATTVPNSKKVKPLNFRWSSYNIPLDSGFPPLKEAIIAEKEQGQILRITGHYFLTESTSDPSFDLGLARASEVKKLLLKDFPEDQIQLFSAIFPEEEVPSDSLVQAIRFEWVETADPPKVVEEEIVQEDISTTSSETITPEPSEENTITTSDNDSFIKYFPYNQTRMPSEMADFLDELAERILEENKKVVIRGHTDAVGDNEVNFKVGLRRAKKIRDQLIKRGVAKKNIEATSEGEDNPIAGNETEEGRKLNRRIQIFLK